MIAIGEVRVRFGRQLGIAPDAGEPHQHLGLRDLNGYKLDFGHHLFNLGPPIEIERVDVPVRREKRLAVLIQDLAEYKRMSLSSLLEETLLHTLDGVGPHTKSDLKRIAQLKQKHGIDYDTHGSYGFVERG